MPNAQELAIIRRNFASLGNIVRGGEIKPKAVLTKKPATAVVVPPCVLKFAQDKNHDDPAGHPYNRYTDDELEQDRRAHKDYEWLQKQVDEKKNRRNRDEDDDN